MKKPKLLDLTGKTYNRLTVLNKSSKKGKSGAIYWTCKCICGSICDVSAGHLKNGHTKSCGCLLRETSSLAGKTKRGKEGEPAQNALLSRYKRNAKQRDLTWNLTKEEALILFRQNCFYCGAEPSNTIKTRTKQTFTYSGIDRLNSSLGYSIENTVPCCKRCNTAKLDYSLPSFLGWVFNIYRNCKDLDRFGMVMRTKLIEELN